MTTPVNSKFQIGDLVLGIYDFIEYLYYGAYYADEPVPAPEHLGVVTAITEEQYYFDGLVYTVLCVDGTRRFFLSDELVKL